MVSIEVIGTPDIVPEVTLPSVGPQQMYIFVYNVLFILIPIAIFLVMLPIPLNYARAYLGPRGEMSRTMRPLKKKKQN